MTKVIGFKANFDCFNGFALKVSEPIYFTDAVNYMYHFHSNNLSSNVRLDYYFGEYSQSSTMDSFFLQELFSKKGTLIRGYSIKHFREEKQNYFFVEKGKIDPFRFGYLMFLLNMEAFLNKK